MDTRNDFFNNVSEFIYYCDGFYNIDSGIYPIASYNDIEAACIKYILSGNRTDLEFDSLDREKVREILEPSYLPI
jgi:hypothetical protein